MFDPLSSISQSISDARAEESPMDSDDDGSIGSKKPSRKRKSIRNANNNDKEQTIRRDDSPDTKERNELAKVLFSSSEKKFKRNLDQPLHHSNECKF